MHGFDDYIQNALIIVSAELKNDCLFITIFDNGCGISEEKQACIMHSFESVDYSVYFSSKQSGHIGLLNIQSRIKLNYGDNFGLNIESKENEFTKITIKLPKITNRKKNNEISL